MTKSPLFERRRVAMGQHWPALAMHLIFCALFPSSAHAGQTRVDEKVIYKRIDALSKAEIDAYTSDNDPMSQGISEGIGRIQKCLSKNKRTILQCYDIVSENMDCEQLNDSDCHAAKLTSWELYVEHYQEIINAYVKESKKIDQNASDNPWRKDITLEQIGESIIAWAQYRENFCTDTGQIVHRLEPQMFTRQVYRQCMSRLYATRANELRMLAFNIAYVQALPPEDRQQ